MTSLDLSSRPPVSDPIAASALGIEFLGWELPRFFAERLVDIDPGHIRWPGAIPAEDGIDVDGDGVREPVFDLTAPNLITGWDRTTGPREGLSEMLALAARHDTSFAMVVPTARYVEAGVDAARADLRQFLERLAAGEFGPVPADFTLEIGTEYHATKYWKANRDIADLPERFGAVFAALADEAARAGADLGLDLRIAVQVGRFQSTPEPGNLDGQFSDNLAFIEQFRQAGALDAIDGLIWHRYVPNWAGIDRHFTQPGAGYADPAQSMLTTTLDLWQGAVGRDLDLVAGWLSPATRQGDSPQYGAPGLGNILQQFSFLAAAGMDVGSIYGFAADRAGSLGHRDETFIGGQLYALMAESLPGTRVLDGFQANIAPTLNASFTRSQQVNSWAFEDATKIVIFLAALDFAGDTLQVQLDIGQTIAAARVTHLSDPGAVDVGGDVIGVVGEIRTGMLIPDATGLTVTFDHDFEVVRLILDKTNSIAGTQAHDRLSGTAGADLMEGLAGDDRLSAGAGADRLHDGAGRDNLWGGAGDDIFVLAADGAPDTIRDFAPGDRIDLSAWGEGVLTLTVSGANTVLRQGQEVLTIRNATPDQVRAGLDIAVAAAPPLTGTDADDRLRGTDAAETLGDGVGRDNLWGGGGADVFVMAADGTPDAIKDFQPGLDLIDISAWGIDHAALMLTRHATGKWVLRAGDEVLSIDDGSRTLTLADLEPDAFLF